MARGQRRGVGAEGYRPPFEVLDLSYAEALQTLHARRQARNHTNHDKFVEMLE